MSEYLILDLIILFGPLAASFEKNVRFIQYFVSVLASIVLVGSVYIAWDIWATYQGHWSFNPKYVGGFRFLGLPAEELLFFLAVPYAGLFVWQVVMYYRKDKEDLILFVPFRIGLMLIGLGLILWFGKGYEYSGLVFASCGLFFLADHILKIQLTRSLSFWITQGILFVLTFIFNGYLTSRPVVMYSEFYQLGLRITTIPLEDFFYGFSLVAWVMLIFKILSGKI